MMSCRSQAALRGVEGQKATGRREYREMLVRKTGQSILGDEGWYGPGNALSGEAVGS